MNKDWFREIRIAEDTCTAPNSGKWEIVCFDNCTWMEDFTVSNNISIAGSGTLTFNVNMTFTEPHWEVFKDNGCEIVINSEGSIR